MASRKTTESSRKHSDATRGDAMFRAEFTTGSGDCRIYLPPEADMHDVLALAPVLQAMEGFVAPTVPIAYVPAEDVDEDDLTA